MPDHFDAFISYARDDEGDWVAKHLYEPLLCCRTKLGGRPPMIFFDRARSGGIGVGTSWLSVLSSNLQMARRIIPVFSPIYFDRPMCRTELEMSFILRGGPPERLDLICPIMLEPCHDKIPLYARLVQATSVYSNDWFLRLCDALGFVPKTAERRLEFQSTVADMKVNLTLPPVVVRTIDEAGALSTRGDDVIRLRAEGSRLLGPDSATAANGIAVFENLSFSEPADSVQLVAEADGFTQESSPPFRVEPSSTNAPVATSTSAPGRQPAGPQIRAAGRPVFLGNSQHVAVIDERSVRLFDVDGVAAPGPGATLQNVRPIWRTATDSIVVIDWPDRVCLLSASGAVAERAFRTDGRPLTTVGDAVVSGDAAIVGLWNGEVHRLALDGSFAPILRHPAGVQALAVDGDAIYVCDLDGNLALYRNAQLVRTVAIEPVVRLLKATPDCLMVIGRTRFHQVSTDLTECISDDLPIGPVASGLAETELPIVIDGTGKGVRLDAQFNHCAAFHTLPGATPVSSDRDGNYCVFSNPDGSSTLLAGDARGASRIIYSHAGGGMAVAPSAEIVAVGEASVIRIVERRTFDIPA